MNSLAPIGCHQEEEDFGSIYVCVRAGSAHGSQEIRKGTLGEEDCLKGMQGIEHGENRVKMGILGLESLKQEGAK